MKEETKMNPSCPGPGRPRGAKNKRTLERERAAAVAAGKVAGAIGTDCFGGDAHALCMSVYKDTRLPVALRLDAAKAALPYERPKLSVVSANVGKFPTFEDALEELMQEEAGAD